MIPTSFRGYEIAAALTTLIDGATAPDVDVKDGPYLADELGDKFVVVGYSTDGSPSIVARRIPAEESLCGRPTERGDVICYINARSGNENIAEVRGYVHDIITAIEAAVRSAKDLDDTTDYIGIGNELESMYWQTADGAQCALVFSIAYEAYI